MCEELGNPIRLGANGWSESRTVFNVVPELRPLIQNVQVWMFSDSDDDDDDTLCG